MGKVKYHSLTDQQKKAYLGDFYTMVALLRGREEVKNFFKDLLTTSEMVMITRRIQIAKMLLSGQTYEYIRGELKVGFSTINQVELWLNNGFGGYRMAIRKAKKTQRPEFSIKGEMPYSLAALRKKYPSHFLLLNLLSRK